jgi:hypothetical protein
MYIVIPLYVKPFTIVLDNLLVVIATRMCPVFGIKIPGQLIDILDHCGSIGYAKKYGATTTVFEISMGC